MTDNNIEDNIFDEGDFVMTQNDEGKIVGGGYKINSFFLQKGIPVMTTYNQIDQAGGKVSSSFENLAIPAGLFYINTNKTKTNHENTCEPNFNERKMAPDEIMDKLFSLIEVDKKRKRKTKKNNIKQNTKNTRRHK